MDELKPGQILYSIMGENLIIEFKFLELLDEKIEFLAKMTRPFMFFIKKIATIQYKKQLTECTCS